MAPEVPTGIDGPITGAANSLLQAGILGALVILLGAFAFYAVWKWNKANEARVKDQKEMSRDVVALTNDLKDAFREVLGTTDALKETMKANTEAVKANTTATAAMERTLSDTVREAVRGAAYRRSSTPTGTPVVPPTKT